MSSPLSSLRKAHKTPLFLGQRPVPFRNPEYSNDEEKLLDEISAGMASNRLKMRDPFVGGLPKHETSPGPSILGPKGGRAPSDHELMTSMMSRIASLEQKVQHQTKEIIERDKKIKIQDDKLKILKRVQEDQPSSRTQDLEKKCLLLQQQVHEMESFLADYGMIWIGEKSSPTSEFYNDEDLESSDEEDKLWKQENSLSSAAEFHVDFDKLVENIKDLNVLAGEGVAQIQKTADGARLKMPDPIQLTLFANGIVMFSGPFRPYTDPTTQLCIQDIMDGYFPSELQNKYPDGVPFKLTDQRGVSFKDTRSVIFTGSGQVLGGDTKPSRLVPSNLDKETQFSDSGQASPPPNTPHQEVTSEMPGQKLSVNQFLNRLPPSVIKAGKVIDIRDSISNTMMGGKTAATGVTVVETDAVKDMKKCLEEESRPLTARNVTTLRIKSETGDQTFIVKMKFHETIGDLKKYLNKHRPPGAGKYEIVSAYPNKIHSTDSATLEASGLTPNAVLHLQPKKS